MRSTLFVFSLITLSAFGSRILRCYDSHDCASCAGYTWCESLNQCIQSWVTHCDNDYEYGSQMIE